MRKNLLLYFLKRPFLSKSIYFWISIIILFSLIYIGIINLTLVQDGQRSLTSIKNEYIGSSIKLIYIIIPLISILLFTIWNYNYFSFAKKISSDEILLINRNKNRKRIVFNMQISSILFILFISFILSFFVFIEYLFFEPKIFRAIKFSLSYSFGFFVVSLAFLVLTQFISLILNNKNTILVLILVFLLVIAIGLFSQVKIGKTNWFDSMNPSNINQSQLQTKNSQYNDSNYKKQNKLFVNNSDLGINNLDFVYNNKKWNTYAENIDALYSISSLFNVFNDINPYIEDYLFIGEGNYRFKKYNFIQTNPPKLKMGPMSFEFRNQKNEILFFNKEIMDGVYKIFNNNDGLFYKAPDAWNQNHQNIKTVLQTWPRDYNEYINETQMKKLLYIDNSFMEPQKGINKSESFKFIEDLASRYKISELDIINFYKSLAISSQTAPVTMYSENLKDYFQGKDKIFSKKIILDDIFKMYSEGRTYTQIQNYFKNSVQNFINSFKLNNPPNYYYKLKKKSTGISFIFYSIIFVLMSIGYTFIINRKDFR